MFLVSVRRVRAAVRLSPVLASAMLTAAIFVLPATSDRRPARAAVDDIKVSATHIPHDAATGRPSARE